MRYQHGKYDPAAFNVPPSLGKDGKSGKIQCHIQEGHVRALEDFAHSGVFPFTTSSDVIRWCIDLGVKELNRLEPAKMNSVIRRTNIIIELAKEEHSKSQFLVAFDAVRTNIHQHRQSGDIESARDHVAEVRAQVELMPENSDREARYKMKCQDALEEFRQYFRNEEREQS